jgi:hypothetical protein
MKNARINFIEFIDAIKKLYDLKEASLRFSSNGVKFGVSNKLQDWLIAKGINPDEVQDETNYKSQVLSSAIFDILHEKEPKRVIKKELVDEDYKVIIEYIKKVFIDENLKKKFLFETTVKNMVISDVGWEILNKRFDSDVEKMIKDLNTVLLKISLEDKSSLSPFKDVDRSVIVELSEENIDELSEQLKKIKINLKNE